MSALANIWNSWLAFVQDHAILAPAIVGVILIATFLDLIKNGLLAGRANGRPKSAQKDDQSDWYSQAPHRY